jgi:hypothetical protein
MLQTQGLQLLDPYKTLRLHPHAPRELVVEAYWVLVSRDRQDPVHRAIDALNASYALLMSDADRAAYDLEHGLHDLPRPAARLVRTGLGRLGLGRQFKMVSEHADFYQVLRVDTEADGEIIDAARRVMMSHASRNTREHAFWLDLIEEAHRTLRNPQLRAQYDASKGFAPPPTAELPLTPVATVAASSGETAVEATLREDAPPPHGQGEYTDVAEQELRHGLLPRMYRRKPTTDRRRHPASDSIDAEDVRLLTLRETPGRDARAETPRAREFLRPAERPLGALVFVDGPRAGERVLLGVHAVTLGASDGADVVLPGDAVALEHARIWLHGEHFMLRQVGDATTRVGGQPLRMPLVLLDDEDEIEIGPYRLRFSSSVK